jgi:two-component system, NarL family, response regulator NreC
LIKIVVADDHDIVRKGLQALLKDESDFEIVGEAANGLEAIELVNLLSPDVLVLDLMMPKMNGLEVAGILGKAASATKIVILSMHSSEGYILEAFRLGAKAYVLKDNTSDELVAAIRQVNAGKSYLGPVLSSKGLKIPNN